MFLRDSTQNTTSNRTYEDFVTIMSAKKAQTRPVESSVDYPIGNRSMRPPAAMAGRV